MIGFFYLDISYLQIMIFAQLVQSVEAECFTLFRVKTLKLNQIKYYLRGNWCGKISILRLKQVELERRS